VGRSAGEETSECRTFPATLSDAGLSRLDFQGYSKSRASSGRRLSGGRDLSRTDCWASRISSACQRSTSPNQNALSLAL
jgi:hypothetical protein